jgi:hypothetical protein
MLLFMDGMAHYGTADLAAKYTTRSDAAVTWSIVSEGRTGPCLKRVSTNNTGGSGYLGIAPFATRTGLWTPQTGGVCGFAIKVDDLTRIGSPEAQLTAFGLLVIQESGLGSGIGAGPFHLRVQLHPDGTFTLYRRGISIGGDVNLGNSIEGLQSGAWAYLEFKWRIDDTAGFFEIRLNTIPVLTYTGDTRVSDVANFGTWNSVKLFTVASTTAPFLVMRMSDLYLADLGGGGAEVRDFLGDGIIKTIFPNGPGLAADWTPVDATPNWDQVNDKPAPDGDATYVHATAPGTRDCHQFEDIPAGATVLAVHANLLLRKEADGTVTVKPVVGQGGVQYDGPTQGVATTAYDRYLTQPYDVNPATGAAWTAAEINAGQWGLLKVT